MVGGGGGGGGGGGSMVGGCRFIRRRVNLPTIFIPGLPLKVKTTPL